MRLRKKCVYICYICIAVNQCCKKMLLRKKKKGKENSFNFENKNKKKGFKFHVRIALFTEKTNFLWYKNLLQHSCALFDAMIAKLPPIPPLTSYLCFLAFIFFCLLINQPSNLKIHTEIKPPPPEKKNLLRLCSLQVINTSSHILCLFVMVNKKKTKK